MEQLDVVIIGQNYSTSLGLIQAAGEVGYKCGVIKSVIRPSQKKTPELKSRYVKKYEIVDRNEEELLMKTLKINFANKRKKIALIPSDDYSVSFIDRHLSEIEEYFVVPNIAHQKGRMSCFMDKKVQSILANKAGVPVTQCWSINLDGTGNFKIPDGMEYPCITKPQRSIGSPKSFIRVCKTSIDLVNVLEEIDNAGPCKILVERYIDVEREYTVPGLALHHNIFIPAFIKKGKIGMGEHTGVTISGKILDSRDFSPVVEGLRRMVSSMKFEGIFDIELLESHGVFFFNEINLRYGAAGYALTRAGYNMPAEWIRYCYGESLNMRTISLREGLTFMNDKAAIENYRAGGMTLREYFNIIKSVDFRFLVDNPDSSAKRSFRKIEFKSILSKFIKG